MSEPIMNTSAGGDAVTDTIRHRVLTPGWTVVIMAMTAAAVLLSIYQLFNIGSMVGWVILDLSYLDLMVALLLPIVFLVFPMRPSDKNRRTPPIYDLALFAGTFVLGCYLAWIAVPAVEGGWEYFAPASARILGFVLWALMIEAVRRTGGLALTIIVLIFSFYPPFAESMPGPLQGAQQSLWEVSQYYLFSSEAIFGIPMRAFGKLVIGFVIFGVALQHTGAGRFFIDLAFALLGNVRGGGAKVAIFSSGLLGSMSGSVITNVLTTGRLTIPAMRRTGFGKETAAAVEACASTGGVLMPPVMGATAFVMASFLNVPYIEIAVAAVIPSLLYYLGLFLQIDAYAARKSLKGLPREELPKLGAVFRRGWHYLFALVLLVYLLLYMKQEALAPYYATAVLLITNQIFGKRLGWADLKQFLFETGQVLAELVAILGAIGLIIGALSVTGLVGSIATDLVLLAGYMRILDVAFVEHYVGRLLNVHPSLLPRYPGLHTHRRVLAAGDAVHGATVHFVSAELDGGPAIIQGGVSVSADDDEQSLSERVMNAVELNIYPWAAAAFCRGELELRAGRAWWNGRQLDSPLQWQDLHREGS